MAASLQEFQGKGFMRQGLSDTFFHFVYRNLINVLSCDSFKQNVNGLY